METSIKQEKQDLEETVNIQNTVIINSTTENKTHTLNEGNNAILNHMPATSQQVLESHNHHNMQNNITVLNSMSEIDSQSQIIADGSLLNSQQSQNWDLEGWAKVLRKEIHLNLSRIRLENQLHLTNRRPPLSIYPCSTKFHQTIPKLNLPLSLL